MEGGAAVEWGATEDSNEPECVAGCNLICMEMYSVYESLIYSSEGSSRRKKKKSPGESRSVGGGRDGGVATCHQKTIKFQTTIKVRKGLGLWLGSSRLRSGAAPVRLCNRFIFNRTNTQHRMGESRPQTRAAIACPAVPSLRLLSSPACFRYALLVFAAAVHENAAQHTPNRPARLSAYTCECVSVSECRWLCHVEPVPVLLHAPVKCTWDYI